MDWALVRNLGIAIVAIGFIIILPSIYSGGNVNGTPQSFFLGLILLFAGGAMANIGSVRASKKKSTMDIKQFWINKGYSIEEAEERTELTIRILRERNTWPQYGLSDLEMATRQVKSLMQKEK